MALKRGTKINRGYATIATDDGINYREIADTMSDLGFFMNHSSARNHVLRVMKKFVEAYADEWDASMDDDKALEVAKSPQFQHGIAEILQDIELERRFKRNAHVRN